MLSKSHECGKMSWSESSLLEVVVPVLLNQDFYFKVGLGDKTDKVVIANFFLDYKKIPLFIERL